jgi:outer membrane protein assembly factor BamE (lipoprotein component of BamABCDE complex)
MKTMQRSRILFAALALIALAGCSTPQPWVKPYERERLADPIMLWQGDLLAAKHSQHVRDIREGARGANGVQGGGCGCK